MAKKAPCPAQLPHNGQEIPLCSVQHSSALCERNATLTENIKAVKIKSGVIYKQFIAQLLLLLLSLFNKMDIKIKDADLLLVISLLTCFDAAACRLDRKQT